MTAGFLTFKLSRVHRSILRLLTLIFVAGLSQVQGQTFTILHTNDLHSSFIGMGPSSDYTPFELHNDSTIGGYARLAGLIASKKDLHKKEGAVLVLDAGDYSMGTPFGAATRETGGELLLMSMMGYDATTFGNHDFDLGPGGLARSMNAAIRGGSRLPVIASNTDLSANDTSISGLQKLSRNGSIFPYKVIERGGIRFGILGLLGKEATFYTGGAGAVKFSDAIEAAKKQVHILYDSLHVNVVICLSHGGLEKDLDGSYSHGDDIRLAQEVPQIDIIIGGHSHTALKEPIIINNHTVIVQAGKESANLGELVMSLEDGKVKFVSWKLNAVNDAVMGDKKIAEEITKLKSKVNKAVFESRGFSIDQPLALIPRDLPNTFTDIPASTLLANLVADAFRAETKADIGLTANGMMRAGLKHGKTGVQTVYDVFAVAPLGSGVFDPTAGSALVTAWFTGKELKNILEFMIVDNPAHPGEYFPRPSGMWFSYDKTRPKFDEITGVELGNYDHGYKKIDITGSDSKLYSLTCPLYLGIILVSIPKYTKGVLPLVPKNAKGQPLKSRVESLVLPKDNIAEILPPPAIMDKESIDLNNHSLKEIKEWQAIMDYLKNLPVVKGSKLPVIPVDKRANEIRGINIAQ